MSLSQLIYFIDGIVGRCLQTRLYSTTRCKVIPKFSHGVKCHKERQATKSALAVALGPLACSSRSARPHSLLQPQRSAPQPAQPQPSAPQPAQLQPSAPQPAQLQRSAPIWQTDLPQRRNIVILLAFFIPSPFWGDGFFLGTPNATRPCLLFLTLLRRRFLNKIRYSGALAELPT